MSFNRFLPTYSRIMTNLPKKKLKKLKIGFLEPIDSYLFRYEDTIFPRIPVEELRLLPL